MGEISPWLKTPVLDIAYGGPVLVTSGTIKVRIGDLRGVSRLQMVARLCDKFMAVIRPYNGRRALGVCVYPLTSSEPLDPRTL